MLRSNHQDRVVTHSITIRRIWCCKECWAIFKTDLCVHMCTCSLPGVSLNRCSVILHQWHDASARLNQDEPAHTIQTKAINYTILLFHLQNAFQQSTSQFTWYLITWYKIRCFLDINTSRSVWWDISLMQLLTLLPGFSWNGRMFVKRYETRRLLLIQLLLYTAANQSAAH